VSEKFRDKVREMIKEGEGCVPHMYLDTVGKVTVGVGNMLKKASSAANLPFVLEATGAVASNEQVEVEFDLISAQEKARPANYYKEFATLVLSNGDINELLDVRLDKFENKLKVDFPKYDDYPEAAKLGLLDMAYNLGNKGLVKKFPTFTKAAKKGDWLTCANACNRKQVQDHRNDSVKNLFLSCSS
jgi:GH24 family phage-related lysozyme (muramidase)